MMSLSRIRVGLISPSLKLWFVSERIIFANINSSKIKQKYNNYFLHCFITG